MLKEFKRIRDYYCNILNELVPDQFEDRQDYFNCLNIIGFDAEDLIRSEFELIISDIKVTVNQLKINRLESDLNEKYRDDSN